MFDFRWGEVLRSGQGRAPGADGGEASLWLGELIPEEAGLLEALRPGREGESDARWAQGRRCFGAVVEQDGQRRCLSVCWVAPGPTQLAGEKGRKWAVPEEAAWRFDAYSHPLAFGVYPVLASYTVRRLRQEGWGAVMGYIEFDNHLSRRVHQRLGGRRLGWILDLRLAGLRLGCDRSARGWRWRWGSTPVALERFLPPQASPTGQPASPPLAENA